MTATDSKLKVYDAVELRGVWLGQEYKWFEGYYILKIEGDDSYIISHPYPGKDNITQLTWPYRVSLDKLRKPDKPPKLSVTGGVYSKDSFLKEYGASMLRAFYEAERQ